MAATIEEQIEQLEQIRDSLLNRLQGRSEENHTAYSIGDRSISKMSLEEVRVEYDKTRSLLRKLQKELRLSQGEFGGVRIRG